MMFKNLSVKNNVIRCFQSLHPTHVHEKNRYLQTKSDCALFGAEGTLPISGGFVSKDRLGLEACYHVVFAIAEEKKPHTIGE